jgi:hypothetical protein
LPGGYGRLRQGLALRRAGLRLAVPRGPAGRAGRRRSALRLLPRPAAPLLLVLRCSPRPGGAPRPLLLLLLRPLLRLRSYPRPGRRPVLLLRLLSRLPRGLLSR